MGHRVTPPGRGQKKTEGDKRMRLLNLSCAAAILIACCQSACGNELSVNIESKGAVSDGKTLCTTAIQNAIDECNEAGGGRVVIPAGK